MDCNLARRAANHSWRVCSSERPRLALAENCGAQREVDADAPSAIFEAKEISDSVK